MIKFKKTFLSCCLIAAALHIATQKRSQPLFAIENNRRKMQITSFCENTVKLFLDTFLGKFFPDKVEEEEFSKEVAVDDSNTCQSSTSLEVAFSSAAANTTEDSMEINPEDFQSALYKFVDCRDVNGTYDENAAQINVTKRDDALIMSCSDCFDNVICNDIKENYNSNSECFPDESSSFRFASTCFSFTTFEYELLESRSSQLTASDYSVSLEGYVSCSLDYFELNKTVEELDLRLCITINENDNLLEIACSSACVNAEEYNPCTDMKETLLHRTVCFPKELEESFPIINDLFSSCGAELENVNVSHVRLPEEYIDKTVNANIGDTMMLNNFFHCRKEMGAYPEQFNSNHYPTITLDQVEDEYYEVKCEDKCSNGAFCEDLKKQYETELQCVKRYSCNKGEDIFGNVTISKREELWWNYKLNFLDGSIFQSYSLSYTEEVQERSLQNVKDYIQCRFESSSEYDENNFLMSGHIFMEHFVAYCWSACGTLPYCDVLKIPREEKDPRFDHCYNQIIRPCEDCRVETTYEYSLNYDPPQQTTTGTFEYNIQSLADDPVSRQYYGSSGNGNENFGSSANDKEDLKELLEKYDLHFRTWELNNLCSDLNEYVGCTGGTITELNLGMFPPLSFLHSF